MTTSQHLEARTNGKIMATATELLEALRGILDRAEIDMDDGDLALETLSDIRQEARAAIAKA